MLSMLSMLSLPSYLASSPGGSAAGVLHIVQASGEHIHGKTPSRSLHLRMNSKWDVGCLERRGNLKLVNCAFPRGPNSQIDELAFVVPAEKTEEDYTGTPMD
jgi:hypothetical protein